MFVGLAVQSRAQALQLLTDVVALRRQFGLVLFGPATLLALLLQFGAQRLDLPFQVLALLAFLVQCRLQPGDLPRQPFLALARLAPDALQVGPQRLALALPGLALAVVRAQRLAELAQRLG